MKRHAQRGALRVLAIALPALVSLPAQALIEAGHWEVHSAVDPAGLTNVTFALYQDAADQDVTFLNTTLSTQTGPEGGLIGTLSGFNYTLDSAAVLYAATPGALLSNATLDGGTLPTLVGPGDGAWTPLQLQGGQTFWLGAKIRSGNAGDEPWSGLGWAQLRFENDGQITLLNSAMGYGETTLAVGAVPEPSNWALLALGLATVVGLKRRSRASVNAG